MLPFTYKICFRNIFNIFSDVELNCKDRLQELASSIMFSVQVGTYQNLWHEKDLEWKREILI